MKRLVDLLLIALSVVSVALAMSKHASGGEVGMNMGYVEARVSDNESTISDHEKQIAKLQDRIEELEAKLEKPKPARKTKPKKTTSANRAIRRTEPGHTHRCSRCGARWSHGNSNVGIASSHKCPNCGDLEWGNRTEGWSSGGSMRRSSRRVIRISPSWSTGSSYNCPSGMCPSY